ncbi:MAG: beta-eliminating lyase-related protein, partial [Nocardioidaceae bacterium]
CGAVLAGEAAVVERARTHVKRLGGGTVHKAGILAAAGLVALGLVDRLADDHRHARALAEACGVDPAGVDTNIVVVGVDDAPAVVAAAREHDVLVSAVGPRALRLVTHLDVDDAQTDAAASVLAKVLASTRPTAGGS